MGYMNIMYILVFQFLNLELLVIFDNIHFTKEILALYNQNINILQFYIHQLCNY